MTDTGPVPGEGLPENAGAEAVQQPHSELPGDPVGAPAPAASGHHWSTDAFLAPAVPVFAYEQQAAVPQQGAVGGETEEEDDLLLMPGPQGSWGDPQPYAQQPAPQPPYNENLMAPQPQHVPQPGDYPPGVLDGPQLASEPMPQYPEPYLTGPIEAQPLLVDPVAPALPVPPLPQQPEAVLPEAVPAPLPPADPAEAVASQAPGLAPAAAEAMAVRVPSPTVSPEGGPANGQAPPQRRPLNLGPPVAPHAEPRNDSSGGVSVRSLADRGPTPPPAQPVPASPPPAPPEPEQQPEPVAEAAPETAPAVEALPVADPDAAAGPEYLDTPAPEELPAAQTPVEQPASAGPWAAPDGTEAPTAQAPAPEVLAAPEAVEAEAQPVPLAPEPQVAAAVPEQAPADAPEAAAQQPALPVPPVIAETPLPVPSDEPGGLADLDREPVPAEVVAAEPVAQQPEQPEALPEPAAEPVPEPAAQESAPQPVAEEGAEPPAAVEPPAAEQPAAVEAAAPAEQPAPVEPVEPVAEPAAETASAETAPAEQPEPPAQEAAPEPAAEPEDAPAEQPVVEDQAEAAEEPAAEPEPEPVAEPAADTTEPEQPEQPEQPEAGPQPEGEGEAAQEPALVSAAYDPAVRDAVHRVIRERRDIRNGFRPDPIPHEVLLRVLEAAHTAPSVGHSQPWDFVVIRSDKTREKMHELAMRQRDAYANSLPKARAKQFRELKIEAILDTPVNIVVTADPTRGGRHTLGRHTQPQMAPYSSALAVENLWLAARAEGLGVGWVSFFDEREMVRELGLPEHLEVVAYLCVGYVDEFPQEPELVQAGWSKRRPLSWVVHEEEYGNRALPGEDPHDLLEETLRGIRPLDAKALGEAWERQKRMTKPAGALGMLEIISAQLSGLSRQCPPPIPEPAAVAIFAGDHGVHAQGVTAWPQEVTAQMVANFLGGGAVCNAFANQVGAEVCVVDVGVAAELPTTPGLLPRKVRLGTDDFTTGPAMSREEALRAVEVGIETARDLVAAGNKVLLTGEMGIANTTASAALISVYTGADPAEVTGRGTGINDEMHARKVDVVRRALELHQPRPDRPDRSTRRDRRSGARRDRRPAARRRLAAHPGHPGRRQRGSGRPGRQGHRPRGAGRLHRRPPQRGTRAHGGADQAGPAPAGRPRPAARRGHRRAAGPAAGAERGPGDARGGHLRRRGSHREGLTPGPGAAPDGGRAWSGWSGHGRGERRRHRGGP